jgi:hypothetical protein
MLFPQYPHAAILDRLDEPSVVDAALHGPHKGFTAHRQSLCPFGLPSQKVLLYPLLDSMQEVLTEFVD